MPQSALPDRSRYFVSTQWLADNVTSPDLVIVDASWYLPTMQRDAKAEYAARHIPGAVRFDIDAIADTDSPYPHMLPRPEVFSSHMRKLGIGDGQRIVVYDGAGLFSAPRVWWTFKVYGVRDVKILDGGLPKWLAEGRPTDDRDVRRPPRHFSARMDHSLIRGIEDVRKALAEAVQVVDARPADRFRGEAPEPRPGVKSGHMPGATNVPFAALVADGKLKSPEQLSKVFGDAGLDPSKPIITSCGSGVSAAILWLAFETLGSTKLGLYDGSWAEWGAREDTAIVAGV